MQDYVRREPNAVTLIHELLTKAGVSMDDFMADALAGKLDDIERIDRLTGIADSRRNASLREIDRRRATLAHALQRTVEQIDGEYFDTKLVEGNNAA